MSLIPYDTGLSLLIYESPDSIPSLAWGLYDAYRGLHIYESPDSIPSLVWYNYGGAYRSIHTYGVPYGDADSIQSLYWSKVAADQQLLTFGRTPPDYIWMYMNLYARSYIEMPIYSTYLGGYNYFLPNIEINSTIDLQIQLVVIAPGLCIPVETLREGVDYEIDMVNGRIRFLSTGQIGALFEDPNTCGAVVTACCSDEGCAYAQDFACDRSCYIRDAYETVFQQGAEAYRTDDEKMIKRVTVEAEPQDTVTPSRLEAEVGYAPSPSCYTWKGARPLDFECQTARTPTQHETLRSRPDAQFNFPFWRRGKFVSARIRVTNLGGGGTFSGLETEIKGWGQPDSP